MGAEASGAVRARGARHAGRALLESDELIFRGSDGYRVKLPLAAAKNPRAVAGDLLIDTPDGVLTLELGEKTAARWAERIRSPKSLLDKLDVKPTHRVAIVGPFDDSLVRQLKERAGAVTAGRAPKGANVVFLWADAPKTLTRIATLAKSIARDGAIWVVHPKGAGSSVKDTDIFAAARKAGLTATKVARFSETHTAEKLVIPVAKR